MHIGHLSRWWTDHEVPVLSPSPRCLWHRCIARVWLWASITTAPAFLSDKHVPFHRLCGNLCWFDSNGVFDDEKHGLQRWNLFLHLLTLLFPLKIIETVHYVYYKYLIIYINHVIFNIESKINSNINEKFRQLQKFIIVPMFPGTV